MYRNHLAWIFLIPALCSFVSGCANYYGIEQPVEAGMHRQKITLAVMPFHNVSGVRDSGMIVFDVLANQLYALGRYAVLTPEMVVTRLAEREGDCVSPREAGALLGAPYILTGRVTEYTYKAGVGEVPVLGITVRLIDTSSGAVLWSSTQTGTGSGNWFQEDSLSLLTVKICKDIAESLNSFLENHVLAPPAA